MAKIDTGKVTEKEGKLYPIYKDDKTNESYIFYNNQWLLHQDTESDLFKLITEKISTDNLFTTTAKTNKSTQDKTPSGQPYSTIGIIKPEELTISGKNKESEMKGQLYEESENTKNVENKYKIPDLNFRDIYRLPEDLQEKYLQMAYGEDKNYDFKTRRGKDIGTNAIAAIIEGLAEGGMEKLNKKVTGEIGKKEFKSTLIPAWEEITGKEYTGLSPEEQNKIKVEYNTLKAKSEKEPLSEQEKGRIDYLVKRAQEKGEYFNATAPSIEEENAMRLDQDTFIQKLNQEIQRSNNPEIIKIRQQLSKEEYDNWLKKITVQNKMDKTVNQDNLLSVLTQLTQESK